MFGWWELNYRLGKWLLLSSGTWIPCSKVFAPLLCNNDFPFEDLHLMAIFNKCWSRNNSLNRNFGWDARGMSRVNSNESFPTLWHVVGLSGEFSPQIKKYFARCPTELFPEWPCCARALLLTDAKPWAGFGGWEREVMWKRDVCPLDHSWSWNAAVGRSPRWHGKVFCWSFKQMNNCCVFPKWCFIFAHFLNKAVLVSYQALHWHVEDQCLASVAKDETVQRSK